MKSSLMDGYSDEELTHVFHDPDSGGLLRTLLATILESPSGNAITDADNGVALLRMKLPSSYNPLFLDWQFVYAFIRNCLFVESIESRIETALDDPVFLMGNPAFACLVYDKKAEQWTRTPTDKWMRCAEKVGWKGVLPANHVYEVGSNGSATAMVALKISPICAHLGYNRRNRTDCIPHRFERSGDMNFVLTNVGRREWKRFCDSMNCPYELDETEDVARAVKSAQEAVGGKGAYGASAKPEAVIKSRLVAQRLVYGENAAGQTPTKSSTWQRIKTWFVRMFLL